MPERVDSIAHNCNKMIMRAFWVGIRMLLVHYYVAAIVYGSTCTALSGPQTRSVRHGGRAAYQGG